MRKKIQTGAAAIALLLGSAAAKAEEIKFWHSFTQPERIAAIEEIAANFESETGNSVSIEVVPWGKVNEKWTSAAAARALPDVSICLPAVCIAMNEAGVTRSLESAVELIGGREKFASEDLLANFHTYNGALISLPFYNHSRLMFYRKDILDELGLEPPTNWDELVKVVAATTDAPERYGLIQMWDPGDTGATQYLYLLMRGNNGSFLDSEGNSVFNSSENIEAVRKLVELYSVGSPEGDVSQPYHGNLFDLFTSGKSVIVFDTMFLTISVRDNAPELYDPSKLGIAKVPGNLQDPWFVGDVGITALNGGANDAADQWIAYLYSDENYIGFLHTIPGGMYPATKSVANNPAFFEPENINLFETGVKLTLEGVAKGSDIGLTNGLNPYAGAVYGSGIIENMMADIVLNGTEIEAAVEAAHNKIQAHVDRLKNR